MSDLATPRVINDLGSVYSSPEACLRAGDRAWEAFVPFQASLREGFAHLLHNCDLRVAIWYVGDECMIGDFYPVFGGKKKE